MPNALLAILILLPPALTLFLKSNAAMGFLALCGGFALLSLSGGDIQHLVGKTRISSLSSDDVGLVLLLAPLLITLLLTFRSIAKKGLKAAHLVPALCAGGLLAIVAAPMFNGALNIDITQSAFWNHLQDAESYIAGIGLLASLLLVWSAGLSNSKHHSKKHK